MPGFMIVERPGLAGRAAGLDRGSRGRRRGWAGGDGPRLAGRAAGMDQAAGASVPGDGGCGRMQEEPGAGHGRRQDDDRE